MGRLKEWRERKFYFLRGDKKERDINAIVSVNQSSEWYPPLDGRQIGW